MKIVILLVTVLTLAFAQKCPDNGTVFYSDKNECDGYSECRQGAYTEHLLCPDGLLFNELIAETSNFPCSYPNEVDCGARSGRQQPQPSENCDHAWGYFASGDSAVCDRFWNCVDGREYPFTCPEGLAFSSYTSRCEWPELSPDCDVEAYLGFNCPIDAYERKSAGGAFFFYASPKDCRKYFLCLSQSPRLQVCELGRVFNADAQACDEPENVQGCQGYYPPEELKAIRERKELRRLEAEQREEYLRKRLAQANRA